MNKFNIGEKYKLRLFFTGEEIVEGTYTGLKRNKHIFNCNDGEQVVVDDMWVIIEDGVITHNPFSSCPIPKGKLNLERKT